VSNKTKKCIADVELRFISVNTGKEVKETITKRGIEVNENGTTEILLGKIDTARGELYVLSARLFNDGVCISRDTDWPQPFKYLSLKDRGVTITTVGEQIHVTAKKPTKGLVFEERDGISLSDNALDVVLGDKQIIEAKGLLTSSKRLSYRYLGQDE
jgi:beta-mannosidase